MWYVLHLPANLLLSRIISYPLLYIFSNCWALPVFRVLRSWIWVSYTLFRIRRQKVKNWLSVGYRFCIRPLPCHFETELMHMPLYCLFWLFLKAVSLHRISSSRIRMFILGILLSVSTEHGMEHSILWQKMSAAFILLMAVTITPSFRIHSLSLSRHGSSTGSSLVTKTISTCYIPWLWINSWLPIHRNRIVEFVSISSGPNALRIRESCLSASTAIQRACGKVLKAEERTFGSYRMGGRTRAYCK